MAWLRDGTSKLLRGKGAVVDYLAIISAIRSGPGDSRSYPHGRDGLGGNREATKFRVDAFLLLDKRVLCVDTKSAPTPNLCAGASP